MLNHTVPTRNPYLHISNAWILNPLTPNSQTLQTQGTDLHIHKSHPPKAEVSPGRVIPTGPLVKWCKMMDKWWLKYVSAWFWLVVNKGPLIVPSITLAGLIRTDKKDVKERRFKCSTQKLIDLRVQAITTTKNSTPFPWTFVVHESLVLIKEDMMSSLNPGWIGFLGL